MNWEQAYREECRKLEDVRIELQEREEEICEMQLLLDQANEKLKVHFSNVSGQWVEMTIDNLPNIGDLIVLEIPPEQMTKNNPRITKYTNQTEWMDGSRYIILKPIDA